MFNLFNKLSGNKSNATAFAPNHIPFRVMFQSPFFELEVDTGNGWRTVHSQEGSKLEDGTLVYPLLRFSSFGDATDYATKTLGLTVMKERSYMGLYIAPPASYEQDAKPRIIQQQNIVEGRMVAPSQVPEAVPVFKLHPSTLAAA